MPKDLDVKLVMRTGRVWAIDQFFGEGDDCMSSEDLRLQLSGRKPSAWYLQVSAPQFGEYIRVSCMGQVPGLADHWRKARELDRPAPQKLNGVWPWYCTCCCMHDQLVQSLGVWAVRWQQLAKAALSPFLPSLVHPERPPQLSKGRQGKKLKRGS